MLDKETIESTIRHALGNGADFAEVFVEDRRNSSLSLDDRKVDEISDGMSKGAGIRVIYGETTGFAHTADLSLEGLLLASEAARAIAKGTNTKSVAIATRPQSERDYSTIQPEKQRVKEMLITLDDLARSQGAEISQVVTGLGTASRNILVANSDGVYVTDSQQRTRVMLSCIAKGDGGLQSGYEVVALSLDLSDFLEGIDLEAIAKRAANRAISKLAARPAPSGVFPVVIKSGTGGILFHEACGHGLEADHIMKNSSVYTGRVGELVASELVTLVDDGTVSDQWGSYSFDDEGRPASSNTLIQNGVLTNYMWDYLTSKKEGRDSRGNGRRQSYQHLPMVRMTNTFLLDGEDDPDEIVAQTAYGVYVAALSGGQVNTATGDFVFGTDEAYLIENGRITHPLRDSNLIGNGPDILSKIDAVGNDFAMTAGTCGKQGQSVPVGCGQPTLRVSALTIGGTSNA